MVDTYDINTIRYEKFEFFSREVICPVYLHGGLITDIETSFLCLHSSFSSALLLADKVGNWGFNYHVSTAQSRTVGDYIEELRICIYVRHKFKMYSKSIKQLNWYPISCIGQDVVKCRIGMVLWYIILARIEIRRENDARRAEVPSPKGPVSETHKVPCPVDKNGWTHV